MQFRYFSWAVFLTFFCGFAAYAQTNINQKTTKSSAGPSTALLSAPSASAKKQIINFEDELVEGNADKPELFYLFQKKSFNYKRLIRFRENFLPEMRQSAEDIKRLRGGR